MRVMGLDVGDKRIGVALSDPDGVLATPHSIITRSVEMADMASLTNIVNKNAVGKIVIGLPRNMDGSLGPQARKVQAFAERVAYFVGAPVEYRDERLTTVEAERLAQEAGARKGRRVSHDDKAAALILQSYLDEVRQAKS